MGTGDILIHIDEELSDERIQELGRDIGLTPGIVSACVHENTHHLFVVDFDPEVIKPSHILHSIRHRGFHAQMVGL